MMNNFDIYLDIHLFCTDLVDIIRNMLKNLDLSSRLIYLRYCLDLLHCCNLNIRIVMDLYMWHIHFDMIDMCYHLIVGNYQLHNFVHRQNSIKII